MTLLRMIIVASFAMAVASCDRTAPPPPKASTDLGAGGATPSATQAGGQEHMYDQGLATSRPVPIPVEGPNEAVPLAAGESVTYQVMAPADGVLNGVGVLIGNYGGLSDGDLAVRACQQTACSNGTASLAGSVDNASLAIAFVSPMRVTAGPLEVRATRESGNNPFAVWAFFADADMTLQDGTQVKKVLDTVLFYDIR